MAERQLLEMLDKFSAAWNNHDIDALMECMADDCVFYAAAGPGERGSEFRGRAGVAAAYEAVWKNFPDARWNNPRHFVSGNRGCTEWLFTGMSADGKVKSEVYGVDMFVFENGKIKVKDSFRKNRTS